MRCGVLTAWRRASVVTAAAVVAVLVVLPGALAEPPTPDKANWRGPCYNCYNYATNRKTVFFAQPPIAGALNCANAAIAARANGLLDSTNGAGAGFWEGPQSGPMPAGWPVGQCPAGHCLVALVVAPGVDFHWYRLNGDGSWSHKPGETPATCVDAAGAALGAGNAPHMAALGIYGFCQYMCVPAPPAALPGFAGIGEWAPPPGIPLRVWRLIRNGLPNPVRDDVQPTMILPHLPSGEAVPDPMWDEQPQVEYKGFAVARGDSAPPTFPPYLRVFNGVVAYYSDLEGDEKTVITYFADDRGLEEFLAAGLGFAVGFEPPVYTGSPTGVSVTGQDGWVNPIAGSADGLVMTYDENAFGLPGNPGAGSGAQFLAQRSNGGAAFARSERLGIMYPQVTEMCYDVVAEYNGVLPATQNLGSFSTQPLPNPAVPTIKGFIQLNTWVNPAVPETWSAGYLAYTAAGVPFAAPGMFGGPEWQNLPVGGWVRLCTTVDFAQNRITVVSITDLTTGETTTAEPVGWFVGGGQNSTLPLPSGVRFFAGGGTAGNIQGWDRLTVGAPMPPPPPCPCDWNEDGIINSGDYFAFLEDFFAGNGDYNMDGVVDSGDYFDFLTCFFGGCP